MSANTNASRSASAACSPRGSFRRAEPGDDLRVMDAHGTLLVAANGIGQRFPNSNLVVRRRPLAYVSAVRAAGRGPPPAASHPCPRTARSVAVNHTLPVSTLNDGLRRGMAGAGKSWTGPDHVLSAYLTHRPDAVVDGDRVTAVDPPRPDALTWMDQRLATAVRASTSGTLRFHQVVAAYTAAGGTPGTARIQLAQSAALERCSAVSTPPAATPPARPSRSRRTPAG
jgi:hypothetical protein